MNENLKIIEMKRKINHDEFRRREREIKDKKRLEKLMAPKKKKRKLNFISLIFVVFVVYFIYTAFNQYQMMNDLDDQIAVKVAEKEKVQEKKDELEQDVEKINNKDELLTLVEKIARDQYKMVKPNEIIYIDKNKNGNKFIKGIGFEDNNKNE